MAEQPTYSAQQALRLHEFSDKDSSPLAQHHTLGPRRHQASPGNHNHDGSTSPKLGAGKGLTLTGSTGGNVALQNLIAMLQQVVEFTDNTT